MAWRETWRSREESQGRLRLPWAEFCTLSTDPEEAAVSSWQGKKNGHSSRTGAGPQDPRKGNQGRGSWSPAKKERGKPKWAVRSRLEWDRRVRWRAEFEMVESATILALGLFQLTVSCRHRHLFSVSAELSPAWAGSP